MNEFIIATELQNIISEKKLIQLYFNNADFETAYIISFTNDYLVFAVVGAAGDFRGLTLSRWTEIYSLKSDTLYISELVKKISIDLVWDEVEGNLSAVNKHNDLLGWLEVLGKSDRIVAVSYCKNEDDFAGKIIQNDKHTLIMDEFYSEYNARLARVYLKIDDILRLTLGAPWLKTIERAVIDKKMG